MTLVAEEAGEVVGFAHVRPSRDDQAPSSVGELTTIYLLAEVWGAGFGRDLLSSAVSALRAAGFAQATLWVLAGNERARRFYEAAGWSCDGATKQDDARGYSLEEVRYRLALA